MYIVARIEVTNGTKLERGQERLQISLFFGMVGLRIDLSKN